MEPSQLKPFNNKENHLQSVKRSSWDQPFQPLSQTTRSAKYIKNFGLLYHYSLIKSYLDGHKKGCLAGQWRGYDGDPGSTDVQNWGREGLCWGIEREGCRSRGVSVERDVGGGSCWVKRNRWEVEGLRWRWRDGGLWREAGLRFAGAGNCCVGGRRNGRGKDTGRRGDWERERIKWNRIALGEKWSYEFIKRPFFKRYFCSWKILWFFCDKILSVHKLFQT